MEAVDENTATPPRLWEERTVAGGTAWYRCERARFLHDETDQVVRVLAFAATQLGLHIEPEQNEEWRSSVGLLQQHLTDRVEALREALSGPGLEAYREVILEYDFRRRGLRMDCVLLGDGIIAVIEFKRTTLTAADRDQVSSYCINLVEFHEETARLCREESVIVVPVLSLTEARHKARPRQVGFHTGPWRSVLSQPLECDSSSLRERLQHALSLRRSEKTINASAWIASRFAPSSSIIDAAISLFGQHDVAAISHHAAPLERIRECVEGVASAIRRSKEDRQNRVVFVSGAPGAGKTLVGLQLAFSKDFRSDAIFVTGNAPLVDVLSEALKNSYRRGSRSFVATGYPKKSLRQVAEMATFKIVKAHNFLGERGSGTGSKDGSVIIFDEAQRTYEKGRMVLRRKLEDDEAKLVLKALERSYPDEGAVVVALIGHNQAINRGETGATAWFHAAQKVGWKCVVADETLRLIGMESRPDNSEVLAVGHLPHSLRYYRNANIERWAAAVLADKPEEAAQISSEFPSEDTIWLTRRLAQAKQWVREQRSGEERMGIIASGQARRLAAEGLFVDHKPEIGKWMLAPSGDVRSSNMLETVQNQFQVQGLELDYTVVAWDGDLRRSGSAWASYKMSGSDWKKDAELNVAKNSYRVLLTRARKGMVVFVPQGDSSGDDQTRPSSMYDEIANYLASCGAEPLPLPASSELDE